eukprot:sb/3472970/
MPRTAKRTDIKRTRTDNECSPFELLGSLASGSTQPEECVKEQQSAPVEQGDGNALVKEEKCSDDEICVIEPPNLEKTVKEEVMDDQEVPNEPPETPPPGPSNAPPIFDSTITIPVEPVVFSAEEPPEFTQIGNVCVPILQKVQSQRWQAARPNYLDSH